MEIPDSEGLLPARHSYSGALREFYSWTHRVLSGNTVDANGNKVKIIDNHIDMELHS